MEKYSQISYEPKTASIDIDQRCLTNHNRIRQKILVHDGKELRFYIRSHSPYMYEIFCIIHVLGNAIFSLCPKLAKIIEKQFKKFLLDSFANRIPMLGHFGKRQCRNIKPDLSIYTTLQNTKLFKFGNQLVKKLIVGLYIIWQERSLKTQYAL